MRHYFYFLYFISLLGCREKKLHETTASFYHWKTSYDLTIYEDSILKKNKIQDIYLRFFDVAWDPTYSKPTPIAQVRVTDSSFKKNNIKVIPTVFITNECIQYIQPDQCRLLAENIHKLISEISSANQFDSIKEIQIDCDWTASTREKYFTILSELQKIDTTHLYSATIRLFQIKYAAEAGVPPVKKGLLMCYNMGNLKSMATKNSILDPEEVKKYTGNLDKYDLPLDVALPLFQWFVLFRDGTYAGLIQNVTNEEIASFSKEISSNRFEIITDTVVKNVSFKKGDILRLEDCSYDNVIKTASLLKKKLRQNERRLVLYHLDSLILSKYTSHEIENIFRSLY